MAECSNPTNVMVKPTDCRILPHNSDLIFDDAVLCPLDCNHHGIPHQNNFQQWTVVLLADSVPMEGTYWKYGAKTNRLVSLKLVEVDFFGNVFLGGVDKPETYIQNSHIGEIEGDTTGGDSGGPWFMERDDRFALFGVHRGTVHYLRELDGKKERVEPPVGKCYVCSTGIGVFTDDFHLQWM